MLTLKMILYLEILHWFFEFEGEFAGIILDILID